MPTSGSAVFNARTARQIVAKGGRLLGFACDEAGEALEVMDATCAFNRRPGRHCPAPLSRSIAPYLRRLGLLAKDGYMYLSPYLAGQRVRATIRRGAQGAAEQQGARVHSVGVVVVIPPWQVASWKGQPGQRYSVRYQQGQFNVRPTRRGRATAGAGFNFCPRMR